MNGPRTALMALLVPAVAALGLAIFALPALAQGDLERTPWATTMIYPVGDPLDYEQPAPGEARGFQLARGLRLSRRGRHEGLDLGNQRQGSEVRAVAPGLVVCTRTGHGGGWGNMVVLAHRLPGGDVLFSLFAHLMPGSITVREGEIVALGQPLGRIGQTGHATGPHLHLEFRQIKQIQGSLDLLSSPLTKAWEKASIVDPFRLFAAMLPRGDGAEPFLGTFGTLGVPARQTAAGSLIPVAPPVLDPVKALVDRGVFGAGVGDRADDALTRGELYRIALACLTPPGQAIPKRWSAVRGRLLASASKNAFASRTVLSADRLPKKDAEADRPAGLTETVEMLQALQGTRASGIASPGRAALVQEFPYALVALDPGMQGTGVDALPRGFVGPPAVTRRQASLLWAYLGAEENALPGDDTWPSSISSRE